MRFFPREKGETAFVEGFSFEKSVFPFSRGKNRISQGAENRGSLISMPLALRVFGGRGLRFKQFTCISQKWQGNFFCEGVGGGGCRQQNRTFKKHPENLPELIPGNLCKSLLSVSQIGGFPCVGHDQKASRRGQN